jgi:hypothetical protein
MILRDLRKVSLIQSSVLYVDGCTMPSALLRMSSASLNSLAALS